MSDRDKPPLTRANVVLITHVLHARELVVLEDWLDFLDTPPSRLILVAHEDPTVGAAIEAFAERHGVPADIVARSTPAQLREAEPALLQRQFEAAGDSIALICKLDTLPYRAARTPWLGPAIARVRERGLVFVTGSVKPFRADLEAGDARHRLTQRFSVNFAIIHAPTWLEIQARWAGELSHHGRFAIEASVEHHCRVNEIHGLRLVNTPDFRVFHVQEWGPRMTHVRERFRAGHAIAPFLEGFQDDAPRDHRRYYMLPRPPLPRRMRTLLARMRRNLRQTVTAAAGRMRPATR